MALDQKTADAIVELMRIPQFKVYCDWLDELNTAFTENSIAGISNDPGVTPDVLRGRAQAMKIIKHEMGKAAKTSTRIQRVK